jgi:alpha-1,3/alpha-1,6-mannosyltransferase
MSFSTKKSSKKYTVSSVSKAYSSGLSGKSDSANDPSLSITFLHPDLGLGGAERLIVDAAVALQQRRHRVAILTSHCDIAGGHCFDEVRDGTVDVRVHGGSIVPATIYGRGKILCSTLRQLQLLAELWYYELSSEGDLGTDVFVVDQLPSVIPLLRWLTGKEVLFYCHFPDLLLAKRDGGLLRRAYRTVFDGIEVWSMKAADKVLVNSNFTKGVYERTFGRDEDVGVLYPCVDVGALIQAVDEIRSNESQSEKENQRKIVLSINRFERKKGLRLAIDAFAGLPLETRRSARLIMAGGYDPRVSENVEHHLELVSYAEKAGLKTSTAKNFVSSLSPIASSNDAEVVFLLSIPSTIKHLLLAQARILLYTPENEHFGIVPLEAMAAGLPVLATDTGGPLETVVEGQTGFLRNANKTEAWRDVVEEVLGWGEERVIECRNQGRERVKRFERDVMGQELEKEIISMLDASRVRSVSSGVYGPVTFTLLAVAFAIGIALATQYYRTGHIW